MEIDFMILWKSKVSDKTDLLSKIKDMLKQLFTEVKSDYIIFTDKDSNIFEIPYKCSKHNNEVYLKIECDYSEAKAAKILSTIRDNITQGKHRADYSIICTYDEASLSYCCRLMKPFGIFERRLRELMYLITIKAFGIDWIEKSFPEEMICAIKDRKKGKITEAAFEMLDYKEIINYLFKERRFEYTAEYVIDEELTEEKLNALSKEEIINIISKARNDTLWNKLFSKNKNIGCITEEDIEELRKYRNDVMHHHTLKENDFKKMQKAVNNINKKLKLAINEIEVKIYTEIECGTIFSIAENLIAGLLDKIETFNQIILDTNKVIGETMIKLSKNILNSIELPDYSEFIGNTLKTIKLPDYSELFGNIPESIKLIDYSKDLETFEESKKDFDDDVENK